MNIQTIRLVDVFLIGPAMMYVAATASGIPEPLRWFLAFSGIMTVIYNGNNYLKNQTT